MAKLSVAERLDRIAQRQARDERLEARLKLMQKKAAGRSAAEISRLAIKAGIDRLSPAAVYGAFLQIAADAARPETVAAWEASGEAALRGTGGDIRVVAVAGFAAKPDAALAAGLRRLGFRWNRLLAQWEGRVVFPDAAAFVREAGGTIDQVGTAGPTAESADRPTPLA